MTYSARTTARPSSFNDVKPDLSSISVTKKTKDYDMFKFRNDNRVEINQGHVKKLMDSIKAKNLLEFRAILVNEDFEVIDGQHRLLAAKNLGLEIYYRVEKSLIPEDIIMLNVNKSWSCGDFLNFWVKQGLKDYINFQNFIKKNDLQISVALSLLFGRNSVKAEEFRMGKLVFKPDILTTDIDICHRTIDYIIKMSGTTKCVYTRSSKFWKALIILIKQAEFDEDKWFTNLEKFIERMGIRATTSDYVALFTEIFNYRNNNKISL